MLIVEPLDYAEEIHPLRETSMFKTIGMLLHSLFIKHMVLAVESLMLRQQFVIL